MPPGGGESNCPTPTKYPYAMNLVEDDKEKNDFSNLCVSLSFCRNKIVFAYELKIPSSDSDSGFNVHTAEVKDANWKKTFQFVI